MTKLELIDAEDKIDRAIRSKYGYGEDADKLVSIIGECIDLAMDTAE